MAQNKLPMRQIQEVLRLKHQNQLSIREIARSCKVPVSTVGDYLKRAETAGLAWPLSETLSEEELHQRLSAPVRTRRRLRRSRCRTGAAFTRNYGAKT